MKLLIFISRQKSPWPKRKELHSDVVEGSRSDMGKKHTRVIRKGQGEKRKINPLIPSGESAIPPSVQGSNDAKVW